MQSPRCFAAWGATKLPLLPSHHTMEMMAKAATTVYEAAVEEHEYQKDD